jgi:hypothetical protein
MQEKIIVAVLEDEGRLECAVVSRVNRVNDTLATSDGFIDPTIPLADNLMNVILDAEEQSDCMITDVVCHSQSQGGKYTHELASALQKNGLTVHEVAEHGGDAYSLACRWADRIE